MRITSCVPRGMEAEGVVLCELVTAFWCTQRLSFQYRVSQIIRAQINSSPLPPPAQLRAQVS